MSFQNQFSPTYQQNPMLYPSNALLSNQTAAMVQQLAEHARLQSLALRNPAASTLIPQQQQMNYSQSLLGNPDLSRNHMNKNYSPKKNKKSKNEKSSNKKNSNKTALNEVNSSSKVQYKKKVQKKTDQNNAPESLALSQNLQSTSVSKHSAV